jgi:hypothetical protein
MSDPLHGPMTRNPSELSERLQPVYDACFRVGTFEHSEYGYYLRSFPAEVRDLLQGRDLDRPPPGLPTLDEIEQVIAWSGMSRRQPKPGH